VSSDISLRDVEPGDLPIFFEHQRDPEATRMARFPARDRDAFDAHWERSLAEETAIMKTVVVDGAVAGNIVSWVRDGERFVGYWIGREHWGRGIATAALSEFLRRVTTRPLVAAVAVDNVGSIRVLEKCGFRLTGPPAVGEDGVREVVYVLED
jgi:RimJ/RimL family protein N-acetyltransferase